MRSPTPRPSLAPILRRSPPRPCFALAIAATLALVPIAPPAFAAETPAGQGANGQGANGQGAPQVANPVEDFNRTLGDVKRNLGSLTGRIEQSTREIEKQTAPDAAKKDLAELQALIAEALGTVSDNGTVATLGQKVIDYSRAKQRQIEAETRFSAEERQYLLGEWNRIGTEAKKATDDLTNARGEFTKLLKTVQTRSDYIEELQALNNAEQMLQVIRRLADDIRNASSALKGFIQAVTPPEPGT
jgi:chromosome segregation ATPase